jgi:hypothetical protein
MLLSTLAKVLICLLSLTIDVCEAKALLIGRDKHAFGLGNQLNDFARLCHLACIQGRHFAVEYMKYDIKADKLGPVEAVIDLNLTNARLYQEVVVHRRYNCSRGTHVPQWVSHKDIRRYTKKIRMTFDAIQKMPNLNSEMVSSFVFSSNLSSCSGTLVAL